MIELGEKEATEAVADKEAAETAAHLALMKEANLEVLTHCASSVGLAIKPTVHMSAVVSISAWACIVTSVINPW